MALMEIIRFEHPAHSIEGPKGAVQAVNLQPTISASAQPGGVVTIKFNKGGSDGVNIYSQRDGDTTFVFLARDTSSPYVDNRPLLVAGKPEVRRYHCRYIRKDQEIGLPSDDVTVTTRP